MIKKVTILFIFLVGSLLKANAQTPKDTLNSLEEIIQDEMIDEIMETRVAPKKDKIQEFSKLTKYGFKDLFPTYSYNATQPYSNQVNPNAEQYMQDYLRKNSRDLVGMKSWCMPYFNLIDNIFTQYGLPKELKYLAVIESNLKPSCTSWVGAAGPWQFMPVTAREYGLVFNSSIDERRDYFKSTHAAARYLLQLYKMTKDWLLVIAAYNGGPGRVFSAIKKSGSRNFWDLQYNLPQESRNHVKKFIATHYVMENGNNMSNFGGYTTGTGRNTATATNVSIVNVNKPRGTGINPYNNKPTVSVEEMQQAETETITGKYNSAIIAKSLSMDIISFNRYNPLFDKHIAANGLYELILPEDKMNLFLANKYQILNECVQYMLSDYEVPDQATTAKKRKVTSSKKRK
jgi:membrane-bound lytic murein transglycosylase D